MAKAVLDNRLVDLPFAVPFYKWLIKKPFSNAGVLEQQQQQLGKMKPGVESGDFDFEDELANIEPGSGGGSRMAQMMAQAKRMQRLQQPGQQGGMMGFEQKFAIPLDEDEDEKEEQ